MVINDTIVKSKDYKSVLFSAVSTIERAFRTLDQVISGELMFRHLSNSMLDGKKKKRYKKRISFVFQTLLSPSICFLRYRHGNAQERKKPYQ